MKTSCLVMTGPKTMKKHWVFLIFSSKHMVLPRKSWCFWLLKAIRDPGWPHQFRAAKKNIKKHWVFELYFWQPSSWPAKLSSSLGVSSAREASFFKNISFGLHGKTVFNCKKWSVVHPAAMGVKATHALRPKGRTWNLQRNLELV